MTNQKITLGGNVVSKFEAKADKINSQISFETYLIKAGYTPLSTRLFIKENPLEIIRLSKKNGKTVFTNFGENRDEGTLVDFIFNRTKLNKRYKDSVTLNTLAKTLDTANTFLKRNPNRRIKPRELRVMALEATRYKM